MLFSEQKSDILKTEHGNGRKSLLYTCIRPGKTWYDTEGKRIQAHGGSVLWAENTFWWYGENKEGITGRATGAPCPHWHGGVRLYASHDLYNWKDEGVILIDRENRSGPFYPGNIMDRPHILFNEKSGTYLLWAKCSRGDFGNCFFAVAESKNIRGPYRAVREVSCAPHHAGDFDLFTDGNAAYIVYENPHTEMICRTLNDARNGFAEQVSSHLPRSGPPYTREAPAFFRHDGRNFLFTSGTTGMPKMVSLSQRYTLGHIVTAKFWLNCMDNGLHFTLAETGWAKASWGKLFGQWLCGSAIFVYDFHGKFNPEDLLNHVSTYKITTFCAPPTVYRFMIKTDLSKYDLSSIRYMMTAGEALNPEIYRQIMIKTGHKIYEGFGQTETTVVCGTFSKFMEIRPGSMGRPSPLYYVQLLNNEDQPVEQGETGEICIRLREPQEGLFSGYYNDPELTKTVRYDGYYHLGDLAFCDSDGYYWFVGRKDDIIKSSGYRIGPFEVESALMEHPAVLECAITAVPDELRGQIVKATVVLAKGYEGSDALVKELQNHVKKTTAPYKYPRIIEFVAELPKTISGKIRRVEIRENDADKH